MNQKIDASEIKQCFHCRKGDEKRVRHISQLVTERDEARDEIERLRDQLGTLRPAAEAHLKHLEEIASHYQQAYSAFPSAEGNRIFAEEYEAKAETIRAALKGGEA